MTMSIRRGAAAMAAVALLGLPLVALADNKHVSVEARAGCGRQESSFG
jgi:hypothetical protein